MYDWTTWLDHVTDPSNVFRIEDLGGGLYRITMAGTVMQQGTPQDQTNFNNIESGIVDAHAAAALLLNFARQTGWRVDQIEDYIKKKNSVIIGTASLTNSMEFPFNNSIQTISLGTSLDNVYYDVETKVTASAGNIGEIEVSDKLVNGFKLSYTGSASSVTVAWAVVPKIVSTPIS